MQHARTTVFQQQAAAIAKIRTLRAHMCAFSLAGPQHAKQRRPIAAPAKFHSPAFG